MEEGSPPIKLNVFCKKFNLKPSSVFRVSEKSYGAKRVFNLSFSKYFIEEPISTEVL